MFQTLTSEPLLVNFDTDLKTILIRLGGFAQVLHETNTPAEIVCLLRDFCDRVAHALPSEPASIPDAPTRAKRPEPTTSLGDLTVTMLNSGGVLFKVKGIGVGGYSVSAAAGPSVIAETLRRTADDLWPLPLPAVAMPGTSVPPWTAPALGFVSCCGNLTIEAPSRVLPSESGFDIVVNAARTNRAPERVGFRWSSDPKDAAKDLRLLADCLHLELKAPDIGDIGDIAFDLSKATFSESKIDRAFAAAEWQFIASSFGLARAALKQAGYPDQQFEGAQVLASTKVDEIRRMGGKS